RSPPGRRWRRKPPRRRRRRRRPRRRRPRQRRRRRRRPSRRRPPRARRPPARRCAAPAADPLRPSPPLRPGRADPTKQQETRVMAVRIQKKITGYSVATEGDKAAARAPARADGGAAAERPSGEVIHMSERIERPEELVGSTYKIKSALVEHAMYVTIIDIVLNAGTEHESPRPFEIFINCKSMDHFQWIVAL